MTETNGVDMDEINLIEWIKSIWSERKFLLKVVVIFLGLGLVLAFTTPVEYEASSKLLPESQESSVSKLGGLGGLAGLAGLSLDGGATSAGLLSPALYPEIANSLPFILEVMNDTVYFEGIDLRTTSFHYFKEVARPSVLGYVAKYTIGLPGLILGAMKKNEVIQKETTNEFYRISKKDWKSKFITELLFLHFNYKN